MNETITLSSPYRLAGSVDETAEPGQELVYGLGFPFQIGPRQMGVFANIRVDGVNVIDMENGSDLFILDDLNTPPAQHYPLVRNHEEDHPRNGRRLLMVKYPVTGGFVPHGAMNDDGTPHRAADTGFGLTVALGFPADHSDHHPYLSGDRHYYFEVQQYRYDGRRFEIVATERVEPAAMLPGWVIDGNPLNCAIPDGDDLLLGMTTVEVAVAPAEATSGVARWRFDGAAWRPVSYMPVTPAAGWFEPTLVRLHDGSLLFTARGAGVEQAAAGEVAFVTNEESIVVWRSRDGGTAWDQLLRTDEVRAGTPVSINRRPDGMAYIAANPRHEPRVLANGWTQSSITMRESLCCWPIDTERAALGEPALVFDCERDLGPTPGLDWRIDHANSCVVRLADGNYHEVMAFRICDFLEIDSGMLPAPQSGLWLAEVPCANEPHPLWRFENE
jgi:hypothetical protein